jgi:hypothetical protein
MITFKLTVGTDEYKGTLKGEAVSVPGDKTHNDLLNAAMPVVAFSPYTGEGPIATEVDRFNRLKKELWFLKLELTQESQGDWLAECKADSISRENAKDSEGRPLVYHSRGVS